MDIIDHASVLHVDIKPPIFWAIYITNMQTEF